MNRILLGLVVSVMVGCGSDEATSSLDDADNVRVFANTISAVAVWSTAHGPIAASDRAGAFPDPACPAVSDDGTTLVLTGGCTDDTDTMWVGTATVERDGEDRMLTLDGWGQFDDPDFRATTTGTFDVRELSPTVHEFDASFTTEGGATTVIEYSGRVEGDYDAPTTWNGAGSVDRFSPLPPSASVTAETIDEHLDDGVCAGQAVSGQTRIRGGAHTATVQYDGATDCDEAKAARWTFDDMDRGLVDGVTCAVVAPGTPGAPAVPLLCAAALAGVLFLRRRWRRGPRGVCSPA